MIKKLFRKIFRKTPPGPVTSGWLKYRDLMTSANFAAERNYILTLYETSGGGAQAVRILNEYLFVDMTVDEAEKEFEKINPRGVT